jgi:hypothetical protein
MRIWFCGGDLRSQLFPLKELIAMRTDKLITMSEAQGDRRIWVARMSSDRFDGCYVG